MVDFLCILFYFLIYCGIGILVGKINRFLCPLGSFFHFDSLSLVVLWPFIVLGFLIVMALGIAIIPFVLLERVCNKLIDGKW